MDVVWFGVLMVGESRRTTHTDATGMLLCRSCGASAPERAGRCPRYGAMLQRAVRVVCVSKLVV